MLRAPEKRPDRRLHRGSSWRPIAPAAAESPDSTKIRKDGLDSPKIICSEI